MGISEIRAKSNKFVANLDAMIGAALESVADEFVALNVSQMQDSKRADDATITPKYSPKYAAFKGFPNPNLKLTGMFHKKMYFSSNGRMFFINSEDEKTTALASRYSEKIFGIAPSRQSKGQEIAQNAVAQLYNREVLNG